MQIDYASKNVEQQQTKCYHTLLVRDNLHPKLFYKLFFQGKPINVVIILLRLLAYSFICYSIAKDLVG